MKMRIFILYIATLSVFASPPSYSEPTAIGQTGLINMPDARIGDDGTLRLGTSYDRPYSEIWTSLSLFPRLEISGRYTTVHGLDIAEWRGTTWAGYGNYKDKAFDTKLLLLKESAHLPAVAIGYQDFLGTQLFKAPFVTLSKKVGSFDTTLGYGRNRIDGLFAGVRYRPEALKHWAFVAEYNAYDYSHDLYSAESGALTRKKGPGFAVEYHWGWLGTQLSWQNRTPGFLAYLSIPLNVHEYVPKYMEPAPYTKITPQKDEITWRSQPEYQSQLVKALEEQNFQSVSIQDIDHVITVALTNSRISNMSRAVGRAARTILLLAPTKTRQIKVVYLEKDQPVSTYTFSHLDEMRGYFKGQSSGNDIINDVIARFATNSDLPKSTSVKGTPMYQKTGLQLFEEGETVRLHSEDSEQNRLNISPAVAFYFNDPSGALHYDTMLLANYDKHLGHGLYLDATGELTLLQDVSKVTEASDSLLPHVRTDVAEYQKTGRVKVYRAVFNKYFHPAERVYARASAGVYEEMFGGMGGQVLYVAPDKNWAADIASDWVKQRSFTGWSFRNYSTVTTLGSLHYRLPFLPSTTATVRVGEFLAKDKGVRLEVKRRFLSGIEFGAWYTKTNGHDITNPGSPDKPYNDKGIFFSMPLDILVGKDTQAVTPFSISPWTRDVGQMVVSPDDLYARFEKPMILDMAPDQRLYQIGQ